jgi:hypothetical protein
MASDGKPNLFKMKFPGVDVSNTMVPLIMKDNDDTPLSFTPLPATVECIDTTDPLTLSTMFALAPQSSPNPPNAPAALSSACKSRTSEDHFLIKVVVRLERRSNSLQYHAFHDLRREASFYAQSLPVFQGDIVPRHYGRGIARSSGPKFQFML